MAARATWFSAPGVSNGAPGSEMHSAMLRQEKMGVMVRSVRLLKCRFQTSACETGSANPTNRQSKKQNADGYILETVSFRRTFKATSTAVLHCADLPRV